MEIEDFNKWLDERTKRPLDELEAYTPMEKIYLRKLYLTWRKEFLDNPST